MTFQVRQENIQNTEYAATENLLDPSKENKYDFTNQNQTAGGGEEKFKNLETTEIRRGSQ